MFEKFLASPGGAGFLPSAVRIFPQQDHAANKANNTKLTRWEVPVGSASIPPSPFLHPCILVYLSTSTSTSPGRFAVLPPSPHTLSRSFSHSFLSSPLFPIPIAFLFRLPSPHQPLSPRLRLGLGLGSPSVLLPLLFRLSVSSPVTPSPSPA